MFPETTEDIQIDERRYEGGRGDERPATPTNIIGVFGMSQSVTEHVLEGFFKDYGVIERVCIVYDKFTGESRCFGFVYFQSVDSARKAVEMTNGTVLEGREIRVDFSVSNRPREATPGRYLGRKPRRGRGMPYHMPYHEQYHEPYYEQYHESYRGRPSRYPSERRGGPGRYPPRGYRSYERSDYHSGPREYEGRRYNEYGGGEARSTGGEDPTREPATQEGVCLKKEAHGSHQEMSLGIFEE
ncbi:MAG: transformer 2-like protein [Amphiamblys sp. WSBS2006]|nr:MAG: transformer 2-like protein [Amphiamblys sp. WSBS2006]